MERKVLEIVNHTRDYFRDEYVDTFYLIPQDEAGEEFVFSTPIDPHLNKAQIRQLADFLESVLEA